MAHFIFETLVTLKYRYAIEAENLEMAQESFAQLNQNNELFPLETDYVGELTENINELDNEQYQEYIDSLSDQETEPTTSDIEVIK